MKVLLAVLVLVACSDAQDATAQNDENINAECFKEARLENIVPNEEQLGEFYLCVLKKRGSFETGKGFINIDRIVKPIHLDREKEERATQLIEDCIKQHYKHDKEDAKNAYDVINCFDKAVAEDDIIQNDEQIDEEDLP